MSSAWRGAGLWLVAGAVLLLGAWPAGAESPAINLGYFNKLAMNGYDVMTYWRGGKPLEGNRNTTFQYKGATWANKIDENIAKADDLWPQPLSSQSE